jgi:hypothetical protein
LQRLKSGFRVGFRDFAGTDAAFLRQYINRASTEIAFDETASEEPRASGARDGFSPSTLERKTN